MQLVVDGTSPELKPFILIDVNNAGDVQLWRFHTIDFVEPPAEVFNVPFGCPLNDTMSMKHI